MGLGRGLWQAYSAMVPALWLASVAVARALPWRRLRRLRILLQNHAFS
jgi:hypothetical protein